MIFDSDDYFFSVQDIEDYCDDNNIPPSKLQLNICSPNKAREIDLLDLNIDRMSDDIDYDHFFYRDTLDALDLLNEKIRALPPLSYGPGEYKTKIDDNYNSLENE